MTHKPTKQVQGLLSLFFVSPGPFLRTGKEAPLHGNVTFNARHQHHWLMVNMLLLLSSRCVVPHSTLNWSVVKVSAEVIALTQ